MPVMTISFDVTKLERPVPDWLVKENVLGVVTAATEL